MKKNIKSYNIDGEMMEFDSLIFKNLFEDKRKKKKCNIEELKAELAKRMYVSEATIHSWRLGNNGPSDIGKIQELACYFELLDYKCLLKKRKDDKMKIDERQKDSLKRIYDKVIDYLDTFKSTDGFNDYWHKFIEASFDAREIENKLYEMAEIEQHKVELALAKEYIELYNLPVYGMLEEYVYDDLCKMYNGKLSYAYRFEAGVENVDGKRNGITTMEDYVMALKKINSILESYM